MHGGRAALIRVAIDRFGDGVLAQTQRDVLDLLDRVRERRDTGRIDGLHLLDEPEKLVELGEGVLAVGIGQFEPREVGDAFHIGQGQSHAFHRKQGLKRNVAKTVLRQGVRASDRTLCEGAGNGKKDRPFTTNRSKL